MNVLLYVDSEAAMKAVATYIVGSKSVSESGRYGTDHEGDEHIDLPGSDENCG